MERIFPDLQASVLCEDVRNEMGGQQSLIGVISAIPAPSVPVGFFKLCLWTRWCGGDGTFTQQSYILNSADEASLVSAEVKFQLNGLESHATNVNFFGGLKFPDYGLYHVEIHLEGELKLRFPFAVAQAKNMPPKVG